MLYLRVKSILMRTTHANAEKRGCGHTERRSRIRRCKDRGSTTAADALDGGCNSGRLQLRRRLLGRVEPGCGAVALSFGNRNCRVWRRRPRLGELLHRRSKAEKRLVTTGPYSLCRNPLYFFSMILAVGIALCSKTFTAPLVVIAVLSILYHFQIRREEQRLSLKFGEQFQSYRATIPRFFPSFQHYCEPEEISISPRVLKRGLFGVAFLLILIGALDLMQGLHQSGYLPVLFRIY